MPPVHITVLQRLLRRRIITPRWVATTWSRVRRSTDFPEALLSRDTLAVRTTTIKVGGLSKCIQHYVLIQPPLLSPIADYSKLTIDDFSKLTADSVSKISPSLHLSDNYSKLETPSNWQAAYHLNQSAVAAANYNAHVAQHQLNDYAAAAAHGNAAAAAAYNHPLPAQGQAKYWS